MGKGRKPDSPSLKLLKGKAGAGAAAAAVGMPRCPMRLDEAGRDEWDRFGPVLLADGRLTEATAPAFALYCDAWSRYLAASAELRSNGMVIGSEGKYGVVYKGNPAIGVQRDAAATLIKLGGEFGLTPLARNKVGVAEKQEDALDAFLSRKA